MEPESWAGLGLAVINMLQVVLLAWLGSRQGRIERNVDGHLSRLDEAHRVALEVARDATPPPPLP